MGFYLAQATKRNIIAAKAEAFHPGQGVYRSSYKNALRLAATETNIAYRTADYLRIQQLDFVVGIQVKLSNNHTLNGRPFFDICDELAGMYPKDFKFVGWHPSCRCYSVKVLKTMDEFLEDEQKLLNGEALTADSANTVRDMPPQFRQWVLDNRERIAKAREKGTESYFLRDNKAYVDGILDPKPNALQIAQKRHSARAEEQVRDIRRRWDESRLDNQIKEVISKARSVGNEIQAIAESVARKYGAFCTPINYKTAESIKRKVLLERKDPMKPGFLPSELKDTARTTIVSQSDNLANIIAALKGEKLFIRYKPQNTELGYTGHIVNVRMDGNITGEIQVNTAKMIYAKEKPEVAKKILGVDLWTLIYKEVKVEGGLGHKYYEKWRAMTETEKVSEKGRKLLQESIAYYSHFR